MWDHARSEPTHEFAWGADSITAVKFNPAEASLLASTGSDRTITLYDIRVASSMRKIVMEMRSNALAWNPMEPFNFTVVRTSGLLYRDVFFFAPVAADSHTLGRPGHCLDS